MHFTLVVLPRGADFFEGGVAGDFLKVRNRCSHGIPEGLSVVKSGWRINMGVLCEPLIDLQPGFPGVTCRLHHHRMGCVYMDVSKNSGTPKSSISIGFSIINHPFWGTPIFGNTHIGVYIYIYTVPHIFIIYTNTL